MHALLSPWLSPEDVSQTHQQQKGKKKSGMSTVTHL
jgi:hypothetical protein